jgi:hypothetical protein
MDERHPLRHREAPGAAIFYWIALAALVIVPVTLIAFAAR